MTDSSERDGQDDALAVRFKARLNPTVAALMSRGLPDQLAARLHRDGQTLGRLKQAEDEALAGLGLSAAHVAAIRKGARADIPFEALAKVLWANRSTCCVCRQHGLAIIVHHMRPWARSRDHDPDNLAVLCLEHHAQAHRRGDLEQNLSQRRLRDSKAQWERAVSQLDAQAILSASRINHHHWWWFNHVRLFELAAAQGVDLTALPRFAAALARGKIDADGHLLDPGPDALYLYQGGASTGLYAYVRQVLEAVLTETAVYNISDDLDRGFLSQVVQPGDLIFVQGRHLFKQLDGRQVGPGQVSQVRRQANGVRVSYTVDRWEAISTSAWASWLRGAQAAASLARVVSIAREGDHLHLRCTGLACGFTLQGLANRSYAYRTWPTTEIDEDDWFADADDAGDP